MRSTTSTRALLAAIVALLLLGTACAPSTDATVAAKRTTVTVDGVITRDLTSPWGLAFLPDGSALVSERDTGIIKRVPAAGGDAVGVGRVAGVVPQGEGGLLGIAVPPGSAPDRIYAYYTGDRDNRVVSIAWDGTRLGRQTALLTGIPKNTYHDGGRLLVQPDGTIVVATGDAGTAEHAQDRNSLAGKILRITPNGRPAAGNPWRGSPVYSRGHRNVQGLALDAQGRLWATEFGQSDVDELNLIRPGRNYGWPVHEGASGDRRFVNPQVEWSPTSTASPSGLAILAT